MPDLRDKYSPANGVIIPVSIASSHQPQVVNKPCLALLDTGASSSCISGDLARSLDMQHTRMRTVDTAAGTAPMRSYRFNLYLPSDNAEAMPSSPVGWKLIKQVNGSEFAGNIINGVSIHVLVGLDVISQETLKMTPDLNFSFSY